MSKGSWMGIGRGVAEGSDAYGREHRHDADFPSEGGSGEVGLVSPVSGAEPLDLDIDEPLGVSPTPLRRAFRRYLRQPVAMLALAYLVLMLVVAAFAPAIAPYDPTAQVGTRLESPSATHLLGTDDLGRDTLSRLVYGTRVSVRSAYQTVAMALLVAIPLGLLAGYRGGWTDNGLMRIMDALSAFPALLLALAIAAVLGAGLGNAMIAITVVLIPGFVRLIRAQTLAVSEEPFVEASRSIGTPTRTILAKRVFPSVVSPLIVAVSLTLGVALLAEAGLSFLGLGIQPPESSWGEMLQRSYMFIYSSPYSMLPPGIAIALAILSFNVVGDGLRDALGLAQTKLPRGAKRGRLGITSVLARGASVRPAAASSSLVSSSETTTLSVVESTAPAAAPVSTADAKRAVAPLLAVRGVSVQFATDAGPVTVVEDVSFEVRKGEVVGLVGESGSGKTVTSLAIMRLISSPPATIIEGSVQFEGQELLSMDVPTLRRIRGNDMAMVFQDPMSSLNPAYTIGNQLVEAVRLHQDVTKAAAVARAVEMLDLVGIPEPRARMADYPHQLSGGMRQRVLIAMALVNRPKLLIADEPTTALDVTVQAQILDLLRSLQHEFDMGMIFVTHDLGVVADICDRVVVAYAGQVVEQASVHNLFARPKHPYTEALLSAIPQATAPGERLASIPGIVPIPSLFPVGCHFAPRCIYAIDACREGPIALERVDEDHASRCIRSETLVIRGRDG